jgi:transposase
VARYELAMDFLADLRRIDAQMREAKRRLEVAVKASGTTVTEVFGVGPYVAATVIGYVGDVGRFSDRDHFASYNGTAPIEATVCRSVCRSDWSRDSVAFAFARARASVVRRPAICRASDVRSVVICCRVSRSCCRVTMSCQPPTPMPTTATTDSTFASQRPRTASAFHNGVRARHIDTRTC